MVKRWTSSIGWISSFSTKSPPAPAVATISSEIAQRPQTAAHHSAEQPLPSKNRRAPILQRRRTSDRKRHRRLITFGRNALLCRRRDRQPLRAGCFAKLLMALRFWRGQMVPGRLGAETRCRE
jgi:hypothetical protein